MLTALKTMLALLMTLALLVACSGARGNKRGPARVGPSAPCVDDARTADAGAADAPASSYYQIGTCPVDESDGEEAPIK